MRDHGDIAPVLGLRDIAPERLAAPPERLIALLERRPPDILEMVEREAEPAVAQRRHRRAHVAGEGGPLADAGIDGDGQAELGGDDFGGLQRAGVGAGHQPGRAFVGNETRRFQRLTARLR